MTRCLLVATLAAACTPTLDWSLEATCAGEVALAVETGDCGSAAGRPVTRVPMAAGAEGLAEMFDELPPGQHCFEAMAYTAGARAGTGYDCRAAALSLQTLTLPDDRGALDSRLTCGDGGAPAASGATPLSDGLLRNVVGCCPECDAERCACSGGCGFFPDATVPATDEGHEATRVGCAGACPPPVDATELVATDTYVCGIASDRRSLWCWGSGGPALIASALEGSGGAAVRIPIEDVRRVPSDGAPATTFLKMDAEGDRMCWNSDIGLSCIGPDGAATGGGLRTPSAIAVNASFVCAGESQMTCFPGTGVGMAIQTTAGVGTFRGFSRLVATGEYTCGIVGGEVTCATTARDCATDTDCDAPLGSCGMLGRCVAQGLALGDPVGPRMTRPTAIRLEAGWGRFCAILSTREVYCWSVGEGADPTPRPVQDEDGVDLAALEISVGSSSLCYLRSRGGEVVCGRLEEGAGSMRLVDAQTVESEPVDEMVAGPSGLYCLVLSEDGSIVCRQLAGEAASPLVGTVHTSDLLAVDRRPVCP